MNKTKIEYLDLTWNPTHGCSRISEGCINCWAERLSRRLAGMGREGYDSKNPFKPTFMRSKLVEPLKRKKLAKIGVSFMGDLFHPIIKPEQIAAVFGIMAFCQQHTFIVLTKRSERMLDFFQRYHSGDYRSNLNWWYNEACYALLEKDTFGIRLHPKPESLPLPNVWLGVTIEEPSYFDRVKALLNVPAPVHFISFEPLLEPIWPSRYLGSDSINWVIVGCETGPGARPMKLDWARDIRDQAQDAGIPFFMKQPFWRDLRIRQWPHTIKKNEL